ncbi:hypothetical protein NA57DRAFT_52707 [Rhizodiscina lignyota]|uniref:Fatty acid hydroxylase domain-containing protein n=1 Tax=Rhizodiscina lignyota TaxID=1504668 RepID=A0A9P4INN7_9PEZI|nr:hypothetical protein NA57DRAFT_52707 [Rhizodiscina lignyota]
MFLDAFISLPILSFFALPWLSSYSTSLNLLFFYMTWSILVLSYPPLKVEIIGTLMSRTVFYLAPALFFLLIDALIPSVAVNLKAHGEVSLPGRLGGKRLAKVVGVSLLNLSLGIALQAGVELVLKAFHIRSALKITTSLPLPWTMFMDIVWALGIRGILAYYIHRFILHGPSRNRLSPAHLHRTWCHSLSAPFSLASNYDHPIPYLLHRWIPLYFPAYLFRYHILTFQLLVIITSLEEVFVYSGYGSALLPGTIVVNRMARRADAHYLSNKGNTGNFGGIGVLDWMHGTGVQGSTDVTEDAADEMEKHDLQGKIDRAGDSMGDVMENMGGKLKGRGKRGSRAKNG